MMGTNNGLNKKLANCTGLPITGVNATGTPSSSTFLRGDGSWFDPSTAVQSGKLLSIRYLTSSGTYTATAGTNSMFVILIGAGGGSGSVPATLAGQCAASSGGGGGGVCQQYLFTAVSGVSYLVGAGGAAGTSTAGSDGSPGGLTSFNSNSFIATAGQGGLKMSAVSNSAGTSYVIGGAPGSASGFDTTAVIGMGFAGGSAFFTNGIGYAGCGGASAVSTGCLSYVDISTAGSGTQGPATIGYGVGGAGSAANGVGSGTDGRAGAPGLIIVYEYS